MPKKRKARTLYQKKTAKKAKSNPSVEEVSPDVENHNISNTNVDVEKFSLDIEDEIASNITVECGAEKDESLLAAEDTTDKTEEFVLAHSLESENEQTPPVLPSNEEVDAISLITSLGKKDTVICNTSVNSSETQNDEILSNEKKSEEVSVVVKQSSAQDTIEIIDVDKLPDIPDSPIGDDVIEITISNDFSKHFGSSKNKKKNAHSFVDLTQSEESVQTQVSANIAGSSSSSRMDMLKLLTLMDNESHELPSFTDGTSPSLLETKISSLANVTGGIVEEKSRMALPSFVYDFVDGTPGPSRTYLREVNDSLVQNDSISLSTATQVTSEATSLSDTTQTTNEASSFNDLIPVNISTSIQLETETNCSSDNKKSRRKLSCETSSSSSPKKTIICRVCLDDSNQISANGHQLLSTHCGHVFCSLCATKAIEAQGKCPTCRRKLTKKKIHPIFL